MSENTKEIETNISSNYKYKDTLLLFEEIYRNSVDYVFNLSLRISGNIDIAEEIVQETYVNILKNLNSFKGKSDIKTWIYRITVNTALNIIKRISKEKKNTINIEEYISNETLGSDEVIKKAQQNEDIKKVENLIGKLPLEYKVIVILRELQGLSYEDISKTLNLNINTVRTRIRRARMALLKIAEKEVILNEL